VQGTILVAEDEPDVRRSIEQALVADGHRVTLAQTTEQALEALGQQRFDAVVSDLMMPGPGGSEVLRQARSIHPPPATIVITGKLDPDLDEELKALGVDVCLPKPFSIQQLKQALDSLLSSDRETRE
jgi:CheY-like chemotaxis protein